MVGKGKGGGGGGGGGREGMGHDLKGSLIFFCSVLQCLPFNAAVLLDHIKEKCAAETDQSPVFREAIQSFFASSIEELNSMHLSIMNESNKQEEQLAELKSRLSAVEERDQQLKQQEQELLKERERFEEECKAERAELARKWQQLRDEITRMEEMNNVQKVRSGKQAHDP